MEALGLKAGVTISLLTLEDHAQVAFGMVEQQPLKMPFESILIDFLPPLGN